jgi:hypothetical protein
MSHDAVDATLDQLRSAETTMGRMLNVLEGRQQEREAATLLSRSIAVVSRLMSDMLAERDELVTEVVSCREALRHRDALVEHEADLIGQLAGLREAHHDLSDRLRDTILRLDAAEHQRRQAELRAHEAHDRFLSAPKPERLPLVNLPPGGTTLKDIEFEAIVQALMRCYMHQGRAAALLGISGRVMSYKCAHVYRDRLKERGITCRGGRDDDEGLIDDGIGLDEAFNPEAGRPHLTASAPQESH